MPPSCLQSRYKTSEGWLQETKNGPPLMARAMSNRLYEIQVRSSPDPSETLVLIPVPDLKATNSFSRISDSGDLLRISSRLIQIWY